MAEPPRSPLHRLWPIVVGWGAVWLIAFAHYLILALTGKVEFSWERPVYNLINVLAWGAVTPLVAQLVARHPVGGPRAWTSATIHLGGAVGLSVLTGLLTAALWVPYLLLTGTERSPLDVTITIQIRSLFLDLIFYAGLVAVFHALDYQRRLRDRELRSAQLEVQLVQAQVQALRMQLNPHFLFNTLHAISSLMDDDVRGARRMIVDLSALLRLSLDSVGEHEVPLEHELAFLERYLQIERVRFGDRLHVEVEAEPDTLDAMVPNLILQPLVENALKHAVAPFAGPGRISIRAVREGEALVLEVQDNGPGLPPPSGDGAPPRRGRREGLGLRNTRDRLQQLYGERQRLELTGPPGEGLKVRLCLPFHTEPLLAAAPSLHG